MSPISAGTGAALHTLLLRAGFTATQADDLQTHCVSWPLMSQEEYERRDLNSLQDELEHRQLQWFTEFGHLNRGDMLISEHYRCLNEKKKFQRRV